MRNDGAFGHQVRSDQETRWEVAVESCTARLEPPGAGRLGWLIEVARQITDETGLDLSDDIEDLVVIAYVGLLDSPPPAKLTRDSLLQRCRRDLVVWAWEQGDHDQPLPTRAPKQRLSPAS